ncbi:TolB family protein [Dyella koreensis]|uniref:PD40 domain-containing protein n=1 Tax=Dyella koreensis TaxID=311235 RepID=A0ABW8K7P4_9GAMM
MPITFFKPIQGKTRMSNRSSDPNLLRRCSIACVLLALSSLPAVAVTPTGQPESTTKATPAPTHFQPETTWPDGDDSAPAFTPDGRTVFFTHRDSAITIMMSTLHDGTWSKPQVAPFSGKWRDIEPSMAPDGSYLVFVSNRPAEAGGAPLTGYFGGQSQPGKGGNIWRVERKGSGWGEPVRLPDIINSNSAIYSPAVAGDGSIYFNQPDPVTRKSHIYRAQAKGNGFEAPVPLSISDGTHPGYDVAVAPDESFLVFSANRAPAAKGQSLLFVAFKRNGEWSEPQALDPHVEGLEARLSPDLKTLFFETDDALGTKKQGRIFQVPLSAYIPTR